MMVVSKLIFLVILLGLLGISVVKINTGEKYSKVALVGSTYLYNFNVPGTLQEAGAMAESSSSYWWLNSGGVMNISNSMGSTNKGEMDPFGKWRLLYRVSNPTDTDNGYHPQNIFRLVSRNVWQDMTMQAYFRITKDNLSNSYNRNISNGILLMSRYEDGNNLYYAGLRVDGTAVIKKKRDGEYTTLAQEPIFDSTYHRKNNPNLLPKNQWIGIKSEVVNVGDSVLIRLYTDLKETGVWELVLEATDTLQATKSRPLFQKGYVGIRTDFMDVEFKNFLVKEI